MVAFICLTASKKNGMESVVVGMMRIAVFTVQWVSGGLLGVGATVNGIMKRMSAKKGL